ncbi:hypothetical protein ACFPT7_18075 [Acidicapsa dinghuensis]|uniref:Uncharacterized protein n=1 Tax=Acidicapsa dinghuensis TaxID=2218256 RepID=A0ABW1ELD9_9BACT|nr:hypothetical protein [Acidicapsa dinghuensis]
MTDRKTSARTKAKADLWLCNVSRGITNPLTLILFAQFSGIDIFGPHVFMNSNDKRPLPDENVVLTELPHGLLDELPFEDQQAIVEVIGKTVMLEAYDDQERAELRFIDEAGVIHFCM